MMAHPLIPAGHLLADQAASIAAHHVGVHEDRQGCPGVPLQELGGHNARVCWLGAELGTTTLTRSLCPRVFPPAPLLSTTTSIQSRSPVPVPVMLP